MLTRFVFFDAPQDYAYFTKRWWESVIPEGVGGGAVPEITEPYGVEDVLAEGVFLSADEVELSLRRLRARLSLRTEVSP
jgi:hypothetical protein